MILLNGLYGIRCQEAERPIITIYILLYYHLTCFKIMLAFFEQNACPISSRLYGASTTETVILFDFQFSQTKDYKTGMNSSLLDVQH